MYMYQARVEGCILLCMYAPLEKNVKPPQQQRKYKCIGEVSNLNQDIHTRIASRTTTDKQTRENLSKTPAEQIYIIPEESHELQLLDQNKNQHSDITYKYHRPNHYRPIQPNPSSKYSLSRNIHNNSESGRKSKPRHDEC